MVIQIILSILDKKYFVIHVRIVQFITSILISINIKNKYNKYF